MVTNQAVQKPSPEVWVKKEYQIKGDPLDKLKELRRYIENRKYDCGCDFELLIELGKMTDKILESIAE